MKQQMTIKQVLQETLRRIKGSATMLLAKSWDDGKSYNDTIDMLEKAIKRTKGD